ncbi:MAG: homocysteine S-methyltransferase family protein [Gammaproteobacteria bacterium]|nr:homocysteine S-methyltransferase family protein [Gammaproteobacteria bacterium]
MQQLLKDNNLILMEAAIVEPLRRSVDIQLHPRLVKAPLIYEKAGRAALAGLYQGYMDIAAAAQKPFLMCAPTWRANRERVTETGIKTSINIDAVHFLQELRELQGTEKNNIRIGGMIGCKNDCYKPEEALSATEAEAFHAWQVEQLQQSGADFIIAETLPAIEEAIGVARAIEQSGLPYFISFVIMRNGCLLDGTSLETATSVIDANTGRQPLGFMVNCAYPGFLCAEKQPPELFNRLIGCLANASSLDHCDLDNAEELQVENVSEWGGLMLELNRSYGVKILGGCCGTGEEHLQYLV